MKKFFSLMTMVAVLSATVIGCSDDKDKAKKETTVAKETTVTKDTTTTKDKAK